MKFILYILIILFFNGCVPNFYGPYYKPSYDDNSTQPVSANCGGQAGPPSGISFNIHGGIKVDVKTRQKFKQDDYAFSIFVKVPLNTNAKFLSNNVMFTLPNGTKIDGPKTMKLSSSLNNTPLSTLQFGAFCPNVHNLNNENKHNSYMSVSFSATADQNMTYMPTPIQIQFPSLVIDNAKMKIPVIDMQAFPQGSFAYYLTEHMQNVRNQSYKDCLTRSTDKICSFILRTSNNSFEKVIDDFNLSGRVVWNQQVQKNQLYIHTNIKTSTNKTWKFDTDVFQITDLKTETMYSAKINTLAIYCVNDDIPITTPIQSLYGTVELIIQGTIIGITPPSFINVQLPPMSINGKVFYYKPIRLELQMFGLGIDPFNC
ncbi:MAG TPA: hypothetical protein VIM82_03740 [Sulfurimonas sp.]